MLEGGYMTLDQCTIAGNQSYAIGGLVSYTRTLLDRLVLVDRQREPLHKWARNIPHAFAERCGSFLTTIKCPNPSAFDLDISS